MGCENEMIKRMHSIRPAGQACRDEVRSDARPRALPRQAGRPAGRRRGKQLPVQTLGFEQQVKCPTPLTALWFAKEVHCRKRPRHAKRGNASRARQPLRLKSAVCSPTPRAVAGDRAGAAFLSCTMMWITWMAWMVWIGSSSLLAVTPAIIVYDCSALPLGSAIQHLRHACIPRGVWSISEH
jgi:hypothetical protein